MLRMTHATVRSTLLAGVMLAAIGSPAIAKQVQGSPAASLSAAKLDTAASATTGLEHAQNSGAYSRASTNSNAKICPECTHVKI